MNIYCIRKGRRACDDDTASRLWSREGCNQSCSKHRGSTPADSNSGLGCPSKPAGTEIQSLSTCNKDTLHVRLSYDLLSSVRWKDTHVNDGSTAVQMFVQLIEHLPQLLHVLLVGLKQHGLEVDWQPISRKRSQARLDISHVWPER